MWAHFEMQSINQITIKVTEKKTTQYEGIVWTSIETKTKTI